MREIKRHHKAKTLKAMARTHVKSVASSDRWKIITGDCIVELPKLPEKAKLIFEDPPYNLGLDYGRGAKADKKTPIEFRRYLGEWIDRSVEALTEDGSIFFMISAEHLHTVHGDLHVAGMHFRNIIAWVEAFGNYTDANFTSCWRPILYFTRSKERFTWHGDQILIPSDRQTKHADARANPAGKVPSNVWTEFPRLVDNAAERMPGFPTQIPAALVERIVLAASDPGDLVVDPFNGSGTTGAAAVKHHRRYIGIEEVEKNAAFARARLMTIQREMEAP
jgi:DNA modification methylase